MVNRQAEIVIRAPHKTPVPFIESLVEQKKDWLTRALARVQVVSRTFAPGGVFLYLGNEHTLLEIPQYSSSLTHDGINFLISKYKLGSVKPLLEAWYRKQALHVLKDRTEFYSRLMGLNPKNISIRNTKSQWGSCSPSGDIQYCWRLVMAPLPVLDYVVVHELAHLVHKDHSANFWNMVQKYCPDFRARRKFLKDNAMRLEW